MDTRLTIEEMKQLAIGRGGECLSKTYKNLLTKLKWKCAEGHIWEARPHGIKYNNTWCPVCAGVTPHTLKTMQELAKNKGGKCLSSKYINAQTHLLWQCKEGHKWEATPHKIKNKGTWCPHCAGYTKLTLKQIKAFARERHGKCLSKTYVNNKTKMKWQCIDGHIWETSASAIMDHHTWCPECYYWSKFGSRK